ncbi:MAG: protein-tyrosine phosphatase family protein [Spirochaeta sp.]
MPGTTEPLQLWAENIQAHQITQIVCLTPPEEIEKRAPEYAELRLQYRCGAGPEGFTPELLDVPIEDNKAPIDAESFWTAVRKTAAVVENGGKAFIHCRGGRGRTGLFAAAVLTLQGCSPDQAMEKIRSAGSFPESAEQQAFLRRTSTGV